MDDYADLFIEKIGELFRMASDLILFLFTHWIGWMILGGLLLLYLMISILNAIKQRQLAHDASRAIEERHKVGFFEAFSLVLLELGKMIGRLAANLPLLLVLFVALFSVLGISRSLSTVNQFVENQVKIRQLEKVIAQLEEEYRIAEVKVLKQDGEELQLEIKYFDYADQGLLEESQLVKIKGNDIFFDAVVLNFEYTVIAEGKQKNLTIPLKIYSDLVPARNGIDLALFDKEGIPYYFHRKEADVYGMEYSAFKDVLKQIAQYAKDKELARKNGIRSIYGNAVHKKLKEGDSFSVWIQQSGGLTLKSDMDF